MNPPTPEVVARRIWIRGVVQGVGFRPHVYRVAARTGVAGWVINGAGGVEIHAEGPLERVLAFAREVEERAPAAAGISEVELRDVPAEGFAAFEIHPSRRDASPTVRISPDLAVCDECLRELNDPADRRYHYAYINCTNCGPRYSIIQRLPYDRPNTTMSAWQLCDQCRAEYTNPLDRRYHAQPTACPECGPQYRLVTLASEGGQAHFAPKTPQNEPVPGEPVPSGEVIGRAARLLAGGAILAVKGIGGYHLACDAANAASVDELRARKFRKERPFALMVRGLEEARRLVRLTSTHERLLVDVARPIVLAPSAVELPGVAPDNANLGIMLPYAPLHHLLFDGGTPSPLVLTSANRSSEPIAYRDEDALERLSGIADAFLIGARPIARRVDDSVVAVRGGEPFMIRRSRGYSPGVVARLTAGRPILALGSDLKNTVAVVVDGQVIVSQHIGDLDELETRTAFAETIHDLLEMYDLKSDQMIVAHDLHPQFHSTEVASKLPAHRHVGVQHHHAHVASVLAEHGLLDERVVGVALDGTGYGTDGAIWGCELFVGSVVGGFERCASLRPFDLPGGDAAARFPVQAAAGFLARMDGLPDMLGPPFGFPRRFQDAVQLVHKNVRCFRSTSAGRLFDAVAALLGFTREATFEGQAAIWLETLAGKAAAQPPLPFADLDHRALLRAVIDQRLAGREPAEIAYAFHAAFAGEIVHMVSSLCARHRLDVAVLSGGVFQNELLLDLIAQSAERRFRLLTNRQVPVNDGGISLGQAALAARQAS
jgi:hydrogenase maturation protein HypF